MTPVQIVFLLTAALIIGSAVMVVVSRNLVHAALWLVATLFGVAILYAILDAGFLAVVQVVVYIGAIAILFIFAVMLTRKEMRDRGPQHRKDWWIAAMIGLLVLAGLVSVLVGQPEINRIAGPIPPDFDPVLALGHALVSPDAYVLPFEVASILLLAALVGAVYIAASRKP